MALLIGAYVPMLDMISGICPVLPAAALLPMTLPVGQSPASRVLQSAITTAVPVKWHDFVGADAPRALELLLEQPAQLIRPNRRKDLMQFTFVLSSDLVATRLGAKQPKQPVPPAAPCEQPFELLKNRVVDIEALATTWYNAVDIGLIFSYFSSLASPHVVTAVTESVVYAARCVEC